jgi:glycosyltransferase involved in cell wall biosynthesis
MSNVQELPTVSILIPMRNEERYIGTCLDSVLANDYPEDKLEIIVVDGMSDDQSQVIVEHYSRQHPFIHLLENPQRIQSAALNIGIANARGEILVRMDAHTIYAPDYVSKCVTTLLRSGATNVGGMQAPNGENYASRSIAAAVSSPFAAGDAKYRYGNKETWVDTVFLGCWRRKDMVELGGFREDCGVNEDYELNYRLRKNGGTILFSPEIKCTYFVRPSVKALWRQYFRYGWSRIRTLKLHPGSLRWRQLVPPLFALLFILSALTGGALLAAGNNYAWLGAVVPATYLFVDLIFSVRAAQSRGWQYLPMLLFVVFPTIHFAWGLGFLWGLKKYGFPPFSGPNLTSALKPVGVPAEAKEQARL